MSFMMLMFQIEEDELGKEYGEEVTGNQKDLQELYLNLFKKN